MPVSIVSLCTEPCVQQKYRLSNIFLSLLNFCQSRFQSLCLPFTFASCLLGELFFEPQPKTLLMRKSVHWNHPLGAIGSALVASPLLWRLPRCPGGFLFFTMKLIIFPTCAEDGQTPISDLENKNTLFDFVACITVCLVRLCFPLLD